ncbi:MAG: hypothetical protein JF616_06555 [Fibrobacteres bacterium]|nr:hypothetical protein [Fibrobacterota bacterium]
MDEGIEESGYGHDLIHGREPLAPDLRAFPIPAMNPDCPYPGPPSSYRMDFERIREQLQCPFQGPAAKPNLTGASDENEDGGYLAGDELKGQEAGGKHGERSELELPVLGDAENQDRKENGEDRESPDIGLEPDVGRPDLKPVSVHGFDGKGVVEIESGSLRLHRLASIHATTPM